MTMAAALEKAIEALEAFLATYSRDVDPSIVPILERALKYLKQERW
jgi:hypothetical protein